MLVSLGGKEEVKYPPTPEDEYEGSYRVNSLGVMERMEGSTTEESEEEDYVEQVAPEEECHSLLIRRNLHIAPQVKKSDQRENIFQTKCRVKGKLCDLIIDGGSESNCVSTDLVKTLGLSTKPHPHPYKLRWLDDSTGNTVRKQCLVDFHIGSYSDQVLCDVINMDACHILLGRPWQHDRKTIHHGYTNIYSLKHEGKTKELLPLPPHKAIPPTKDKQPIHLIGRRQCDQELKIGNTLLVLFTKESTSYNETIPPAIRDLIQEYKDVFPADLP